ncbi:cytochrome P450 family protein [Streptomyces candidus]|uniref:Cytochrome P450 n=1 Tax=Streptomyces candidus TaxID=67283 RepID=A0A7X0HNM4_9ACTN|nr:cytochrome P450 [Streptomyces candidus]MBB6439672.1 cytochrome P450 [Streptomyces candidus]GHH56753.1 cytochrome P450 [Streptomyces candidus]
MTSNPAPIPAVTLDSSGGRRLFAQAEELRAAGPAVQVRLPDDVMAWSVVRGDVAKRLLTHPHVSKDARRTWPSHTPGSIPWLYAWVDVVSMFTSDGDDHKRLRQLVSRAFTPGRVEAMRPVLKAIVTDLLDGLAGQDRSVPLDLRAHFSYRVPTRLICDLFGVPADQRPEMLRVIDSVLTTDVTAQEAEATKRDLGQAMQMLVDVKRTAPGEDMTSLLLAAHEEDGDRLSHTELISTLILMIGAGSETAVALINAAVRELLTHPDQLATVLADPARWRDVIEEALRLHPPIMHLPLRYATTDIDLGEGVTIREGDAILIGFGAHGRDPGIHDDPAAFRIDRADKDHMAFGHGVHYCLGAPLARLEAEVALPALFDRFPQIALAANSEDLKPQRSFIGNDVAALPVVLEATP